jgi:ankyrin repeat protein
MATLLSYANDFMFAGRSAQEAFKNDGVVKLLKVVSNKDANEAKRLIDSGINVNTIGKDGATPLIWMLGQQDLQAVKLLLEVGADPNQYQPNGVGPPVWLSAGGGRKEALQLLLNHGGNPNLVYGTNSPLMMAINNSHMSCAELLLQSGADINYSNGPLSALSAAIFSMQFDDVLWVLNHGYTHDLIMARKMIVAETPRAGQEQLKFKALEIVDRLLKERSTQ